MLTMTELDKMNVDELRKLCIEHGLPIRENAKYLCKATLQESLFAWGRMQQESDRLERKHEYIVSVPLGTIVAIRTPEGAVVSGKIEKRSTSDKKLLVCTRLGIEYLVDFADVLWVKTGNRWPKGVYVLFKETAHLLNQRGLESNGEIEG